MSSLKGKVAIITGSSRGIGKAIAIKLAQEGLKIILNGRNQERLDRAKLEIEKINTNILCYCCDVTEESESKKLIDFALKQFGRLDILITNVGVSNRGTVANTNPEVFRRVFSSNFFGSIFPTLAALPHIKNNKGSIVFISSVAGIRGLPSLGAYCSSKMALRAIAESIRIEEYPSGIHVGLVYVGKAEIEHNKESIAADGSLVILKDRSSKNILATAYIAKKVFLNIKRRKFITTLSTIGKINLFMQSFFPMLVEKIIIKTSKKFNQGLK